MSENVVKIRCPYCAGKIGVDANYYQELAGEIINCPHCSKEMIVPANAEGTNQNSRGSHNLDRTQEIQVFPKSDRTVQNAPTEARHCPHCKEEVRQRNRVCITCGRQIPLLEPPPGFSHIRV
ncbi:MAG: hypothetical protein QME60_02265 [Verrucomicrobiota bacterium]|nr:hypothetical protein [Verrucomicrobiota bacterium]